MSPFRKFPLLESDVSVNIRNQVYFVIAIEYLIKFVSGLSKFDRKFDIKVEKIFSKFLKKNDCFFENFSKKLG